MNTPATSGNDKAAALAMATHLQTGLITPENTPKNSMENGQNEPKTGEPNLEIAGEIEGLETQFKDFKREINSTIKEQIGQVTQLVKDALSEDEKE